MLKTAVVLEPGEAMSSLVCDFQVFGLCTILDIARVFTLLPYFFPNILSISSSSGISAETKAIAIPLIKELFVSPF